MSSRKGFSILKHTLPGLRNTVSSIEQTISHFEDISREMMRRSLPISQRKFLDEGAEEFFKDIPPASDWSKGDSMKQKEKENNLEHSEYPERSFSSYSFSSTSVMNNKGETITSSQRQYEDSSGRFKSVEERSVGDRTLKSVWKRNGADEAEQREQICDSMEPDEFEKMWAETPFAKKTKQLEDQ